MLAVIGFSANMENRVNQHMAQAAQLFDQVAKHRDLYREVYPLLARQGWLVSPSTPAGLLDELMIRVRQGGPDRSTNGWLNSIAPHYVEIHLRTV